MNPHRKKRHYRVFMIIVLLVGLGVGFFWYEGKTGNQEFISPLATDVQAQQIDAHKTQSPSPSASPFSSPASGVQNNGTLTEQVAAVTSATSGVIGIAVKNLKTGETYYEHAEEPFIMASTYKLPLVLTSFIDEESGKLPSTTKLGSFTLEKGRELVIIRSEENLAQLLGDKVGWKRIGEVSKSMGMKETYFTTGFTTTPKDMLTILEKIYKGEGMSKTVRDNMYDLLVRQQINDRLPKYLPKNVTVAHKTGEIDDKRHDVGIVTAYDTTYVIVLMSKELGAPERDNEILAKLSLVFYEHFTK